MNAIKFEEAVRQTMEHTGWSKKKAERELRKAIASGEVRTIEKPAERVQ